MLGKLKVNLYSKYIYNRMYTQQFEPTPKIVRLLILKYFFQI